MALTRGRFTKDGVPTRDISRAVPHAPVDMRIENYHWGDLKGARSDCVDTCQKET